jgi:hypothetical protein
MLLTAMVALQACDASGTSKATSTVTQKANGPADPPPTSRRMDPLDQDDAALPPPVRPVWLTQADLERTAKAFGTDADRQNAFASDLDFFVLMCAVVAAEVKSRDDALAAAVLSVKYALHRLFYHVSFDKTQHPADDADFYRTLVTFERRAGLKVDGKFTVSEWERLNFLASLEGEPEVAAGVKSVYGSGEYARAEGTLVIQDDRIANPVNRVEITCMRSEGRCDLFIAELALPEGRKSDPGNPQLTTYIEHYDISEWAKDELRAKTTTACRQIVLTLNWVTDHVHSVATDLSKEGCPATGRLAKPRLVTLEDGSGPIKQFYESRRDLLRRVSNSPMERLRSLYSREQSPTSPTKGR